LTYELGKIFEGAQVCLKPYACCQFAHGAITATLELLEEYNIRAEDVQQVHVGLSPKAYNFTCEPEEVKANPRNIIDAQFSAYYTVAVAVLERDVFIEHFTQEMIRCPEVRQTMKKVKPEIELELKESDLAQGAVVTIKTTSGQKYTRKVYYTKGHPKNPMTMDEVRAKFRRCVPFSARPLHMKNAERIIAMVRNLEEVSDVSEIAGLLVP
jgi:2-methylcitrate dehydratase PrpD